MEINQTDILYQCPNGDCRKVIKRTIVHSGPLVPPDLYGHNRCPHCGEGHRTIFKIQNYEKEES